MNNKKFISFLPYILVLGIMLLLISYGSEGNTKNFKDVYKRQAQSSRLITNIFQRMMVSGIPQDSAIKCINKLIQSDTYACLLYTSGSH